jgi:hypothetical protein
MTNKLTQLQTQLQRHLSHHQNDPSDPLIAKAAFCFAEEGLENLKSYPTQFPFKNGADHELYYHIVFPLFASAYQYLGKVCWTLKVKFVYDRETYADFLQQEMELVTKFLKYHLQYNQYATFEPVKLPSRSVAPPKNTPTKKSGHKAAPTQQLQMAFHSPALKAHVDYKGFLEKEKKALDTTPLGATGDIYEFVGSQADAMENIEGWTEMQVIKVNGQVATLRQVADMWTSWFRKPIANIYSKKRINQHRKKEKAPFVTKMAEVLRESASRPRTKRV